MVLLHTSRLDFLHVLSSSSGSRRGRGGGVDCFLDEGDHTLLGGVASCEAAVVHEHSPGNSREGVELLVAQTAVRRAGRGRKRDWRRQGVANMSGER